MADVLSNWAANMALSYIVPKSAWLALHLTDPTVLGSAGSELAGGGYIRQAIGFHVPTNRGVVSTNAQTFPGLPACNIYYLAVWTSLAGGHMIFSKGLNPHVNVLKGGQFLAAAGDVALSL